jgi:hypothetical protein
MEERKSLPVWLYVSVTLGAILMAMGAIIALVKPGLLLGPGEAVTTGVRVYAGYLWSRNLALASALIVLVARRSRYMLRGMMLLTALVQLLDAVLDAVEGRWVLVPGVVVFAIVLLLGAEWLARRLAGNGAEETA